VIVLLVRHAPPPWVYPALLLALLSVYGGGVLTRVPLYLSNRTAWAALAGLLPPGPGARFVDLGAGLGGPVVHLARLRPDAACVGVEASPLTCLAAWIRALPLPGARIRWTSLWHQPLEGFDLVFAFLSPAPMERLWAKALREMKAGSLFVSHTFEVPGQTPHRRIPLPGRKDACLLVWRMPGAPQ
jgi:SAM-dependent methyltransferase